MLHVKFGAQYQDLEIGHKGYKQRCYDAHVAILQLFEPILRLGELLCEDVRFQLIDIALAERIFAFQVPQIFGDIPVVFSPDVDVNPEGADQMPARWILQESS